jgi:hypothetical protein
MCGLGRVPCATCHQKSALVGNARWAGVVNLLRADYANAHQEVAVLSHRRTSVIVASRLRRIVLDCSGTRS